MLDENMQDFHRRLARVARVPSGERARGGHGLSGLRVLLLLLTVVIAVKAAMLLRLGGEEYEARLAALRGAEPARQIGAILLQIDPATAQLADWLRGLAGPEAG